MAKNIPVIIHHECRTEYARKCIQMAEKFNKQVIFLGDETNRDFSKNWVDVNLYCKEEWQEFRKYYKNLSFYDDGYAIKIFKRFFAMKNYMNEKGLKECVLIDSDVLTYENYSKIPVFGQCDATLFIPEEEEKGSDPLSYGNYYWGASAGTSYFKYEVLEDIVNFMIETYKNHFDLLEKKWKWHQENNYGGGVCEMTLLFLWYLQTDYKVINTKRIFGEEKPYVIDNDVRTVNDRCNFIKYSFANIERIKLIEKKPYLIENTGRPVKAVCLHFGGETKKYMKAYMQQNIVSHKVLLFLTYCYLCGFHLAAKIYIALFKKWLGKYRKNKYGNTF